ncbi:exodeoxyribonuclease V subunit gamma [Parachlamydia sp. AcF125]|uniref:exodeoxyribonuclease V subunit gamma n=1 Tax=Parachlamydia sp. AcF125 TaxID=2795736 RepID=UPI001BC9C95A|nr:exodeoxyribonuclease V subunit gamma [Parachlamydia sp. AcF125]MBS4167840.1 RecBCD enzyme subunit RecC [Parachlamydia sp. AcF125]
MFHQPEHRVFFSNQAELLIHPLKQQLIEGQPFCQRLIIVPSPAMKSWIMFKMAEEFGIAMGFEILYLDQGIQRLYHLLASNQPPAKHPSSFELTLALEVEIRQALMNYSSLSCEEVKLWKPLFNYLKFDPSLNFLPQKGEKRLIALVEKLASLFLEYGISGGEALALWEQAPSSCWQAYLWKRLFKEGNSYNWTYPYQFLTRAAIPEAPTDQLQVHLFAMSYLPRLYQNFFEKIAKTVAVSFYLLSPCEAFWSDIYSDKESKKMQLYWKKQEASEAQQVALEELLRDKNPLLANFGRLGREMAIAIEDSNAQTVACYTLPACVRGFDCYEEKITPELLLHSPHKDCLSLLQAIQADMVLFRNPELSSPLALTENDSSIQIHAAPSLLREVQILHDNLIRTIYRASTEDPIFPNEWIVMAPDIRLYTPFIKMVFGHPNSPLAYQIMDAELPEQNLYIQSFLHLLKLSSSRWDTLTLLTLFDYLPFRNKWGLEFEDIDQIRMWIKETGIRWGMDVSHRKAVLKKEHCPQTLVDENPAGTWEHGFQMLLKGFVVGEDLTTFPVENTQGSLLGNWIYLVRSLYQDLKPLSDNSSRTIQEWGAYLQNLANFYLLPENSEHKDLLEILLKSFLKDFLPHHSFSFQTIRPLLVSLFKKETVSYSETSLRAVKFCSMLPMRAIPSKGIALMGLEEGAFPRFLPESSLHLLARHPLADYAPSQVDFDRYLFLETLISAREYLLLSYQAISPDGKEHPPSLLVQELLSYMDKSYRLGNSPPSKQCFIKHPFHAYACHYFTDPYSPISSFSQENYHAAKANLSAEKTPKHHFIPRFLSLPAPSINHEEEHLIEIKQLTALTRNPFEHYFNKKLGIYLEKEDARKIPSDDFFCLTSLFKASLKREALKFPLETLLLQNEVKGCLPSGYFKTLAVDLLKKEIEQTKTSLLNCGVNLEHIFQIELTEAVSQPTHIHPTCWLFPPLEFDYHSNKKIKIIGVIPEVTPQGLLAFIRDEKREVIKAWPAYLILNCLAKIHPNIFGTHLIFAKSGSIKTPFFEHPFSLLEQFLDYYFICQTHISPLLPQWIPEMVENPASCQTKIQKSLTGHFTLFNEYVDWITRGNNELDYSSLISEWREVATTYFSPIYSNWYSSKRKGESDV